MKYFVLFILLSLFYGCSEKKEYIADKKKYLNPIVEGFKKKYPEATYTNIVFHGHSVPCGVFVSPEIKPFDSYPHLVYQKLKDKYPYAIINIILTCKEGENSKSGSERFVSDVLTHKPDVLIIDYALNDVGLSLTEAEKNWSYMITKALEHNTKIILLTPTPDLRYDFADLNNKLYLHREFIIKLAKKYHIGLVDCYGHFLTLYKKSGTITNFMTYINHPNKMGHEEVANLIIEWF